MDTNNNQTLSIDEFFEVVEVLESHESFAIPLIKRRTFWKTFREKINKKFHFFALANSFPYNLIIFILMIINCAILITCELIEDPDNLLVLYLIDEILLYIYLLDFFIKILGHGFEQYYSDIWNKFDFLILLVSFISEFFLIEYSISTFEVTHSKEMSQTLKVFLKKIFNFYKDLIIF